MTEFILETCGPTDISAIDLREEIASANEPVECFRLIEIGEDGYRKSVSGCVVWFPDSRRAGIEFGGNADWTDATSPDDAIELWHNDDMRN